jgi:hypothetical protein
VSLFTQNDQTMLDSILSVFKAMESEGRAVFYTGRNVSIKSEFFECIDSFDTPKDGWRLKAITGRMATLVRKNGKPGKLFIETKYLTPE